MSALNDPTHPTPSSVSFRGDVDVRLTDTTLRDGSHAMAHQFTEAQVRAVVHALDRAGVEVIEVSAPNLTLGDGGPTCLTRPLWREA